MCEERELKACKECTNRCQLTHGKKSQHRCTSIAFFKIMIGRFSETLFLPPKFHREVVSLGHQCMLEDVSGQMWRVKLSMMNGSLAFQEGWTKFVSEHDVKFGEMLIFNHIFKSHFLVQIFGTCGCERLNFSKRKTNDQPKGKQKRKMDLSGAHSPSSELPCHMVETRAMKKMRAKKGETSPENLSDFEITMNKCQVDVTGKSLSNSSDVEMSECKEKSPTSTDNSDDARSSGRTSDASDVPCCAVDEDSLVENKLKAEKGDVLTTPENPAKHAGSEVGSYQKTCFVNHKDSGNGKDTANTNFSLSSADIALLGTKSDAEATRKLSSMLQKSFSYDTRSKKNLDVAKAPCHEDGGNLVDGQRAGKCSVSPSKSSYLKKVATKCDTEVAVKLPKSSNSLVYAIRPEQEQKSVIDNDSMTEKSALEDKAANSKLSDFVSHAPGVANVLLGVENSSHEMVSSKTRPGKSQISFDNMEIDEGEMRNPSDPSGLHFFGEVKIKCNACTEVPTIIEESPCHENSSKNTLELRNVEGDSKNIIDLPNAESSSKNTVELPNAECDLVYGNSVNEGGAAILIKCNADSGDGAQNSTGKLSDHTISLHSCEEVNVKCNDAPMEEIPIITVEESSCHESNSRNTIDHSNTECEMVYGNSMNEEVPAIWSKCDAKDGDGAQNSTEKSSDFIIGSKMKQIMEYTGDNKSRNKDEISTSKTIRSESSESQRDGSQCEAAVGAETRENSHSSSSKMNCDYSQNLCCKNDEKLVSKERTEKNETASASLPDLGITDTDCTAEEMDKALTTTGGTDHSENISAFGFSGLPCDIIDENLDNRGVIGTDIAFNSHELFGDKCSTGALDSPYFVIDEHMKKEEGHVESQTGHSNFIGLKLSETDCHPDDMDKVKKVMNNSLDKGKKAANNSSQLELSFTRIQTMPSIGCNGSENGIANISDADISRSSLSREQKFVHSGKWFLFP